MLREKAADPDIQLACDDFNIFKWTALIKVNLINDCALPYEICFESVFYAM